MSGTGLQAPVRQAVKRGDVARLYVALGRLTRLLRRHQSGGLAPGQLSALSTLVKEGPMRAGDLAGREGVAAPTLSRILASLESQGYVEREPDPEDRRSVLLQASEQGERAFAEVRAERTRLLAERLDRLAPEHRDTLLAAVDALEALAGD